MELRIRQYIKNSKFTDQIVFPYLELDFNINKELKVKLEAKCDQVFIVYNGENGEILKFENYIGNSLINQNHPIINYDFFYFNNELNDIVGLFNRAEKLMKLSDTLYLEVKEKEVNPFNQALESYVRDMNGCQKYIEYSIYITTNNQELLSKYEYIDFNNNIKPNTNLLEIINKIIEEKIYYSKTNLFISEYEIDGIFEYSNPYENSWLKFNHRTFSDIYIETCEIFEFSKINYTLQQNDIKCMDLLKNTDIDNIYTLIDMPFSEEKKTYYSRIKELFYTELDKYF